MSTVRTLLPTDLPALLAHPGLSRDNLAFPRERIGAGDGQANLSAVADQLRAFARQRQAWVCMRRQRLQGLVGARQRGGNAAWEIDYLLDATTDGGITAGLIDYAVAQVGKQGAQKLFLRLPADCGLMQPVLQSGFVAYQEETLFVRRSAAGGAGPPEGLRPVAPADSYPLFRLYCAAVPEAVRRFEAATFDEWHAAQERRWQKNGVCFVIERDAAIQAQIRACRLPHGVMLDLLFDADAAAGVPALIDAAVSATAGADGPVLALLPQDAAPSVRALQAAGFTSRDRYVSLVRRTAKPIALPRKVPVVAKNAVGV